MEFDKSPLMPLVQDIIATGANEPTMKFSALIWYSETEYVEPLRVVSIDNISNFLTNFSDGLILTMAVTTGKLAYKLAPNRETLTVELNVSSNAFLPDTSERDAPGFVERFKAIMTNVEDDLANQYSSALANEFKLDLFDFKLVKFQLLSEYVEQLRKVTFGTNFIESKVSDMIKTAIHTAGEKIEAKTPFKGIVMSGTPREAPDRQTMIPHGTRLVDIPKYLQESQRGVFGSGLSSYYRDGYWYIWPSYDTTRFTKEDVKLTIINVPQTRFPGMERTFKYEGNSLTIVTTGETKTADMSDIFQANKGNASRTLSASALAGSTSAADTKNNKTFNKPSKAVSEVMSTERKKDQLLNYRERIKVTDNVLNELSKSAASNGRMFSFVWENSDHSAIIPGMPCRLMYWDGEKTVINDGVVVAVQSYTHPAGGNILRGRHTTVSGVYVFMSKEEPA